MSASLLNYLTPYKATMYIAGTSEKAVMEGYRLCVLSYKSTTHPVSKKVIPAKPACCTVFPLLPLSVAPAVLQDALLAALEGIQDAAFRACVSAALEADSSTPYSAIVVPLELGTPEGLAAFSAAQAASGRLSRSSLLTAALTAVCASRCSSYGNEGISPFMTGVEGVRALSTTTNTTKRPIQQNTPYEQYEQYEQND